MLIHCESLKPVAPAVEAAANTKHDRDTAALIMMGELVSAIVSIRSHDPAAGPGPGRFWSEERQH